MIRKRRVFSQNLGVRNNVKGWQNSLKGLPAFIIGNAPSLTDADLTPLCDYFTIGINRTFLPYLNIDPTILLWQDAETWYSEKHRIIKLEAIKYCRDTSDVSNRFYHFRLAPGGFQLPQTPERLHGRGASGPLAFQLAYAMGCDPIILLGMDCCYREGKTNTYGINRYHNRNTLINCRKGLQWIRDCQSGKTIINCSANDVFDHQLTLDDAIKRIGNDHKISRYDLQKRILG